MGSSHSISRTTHQDLPRVLADYGGRRKIFERRLDLSQTDSYERRAGKDRRSGFDRRSTLIPPLNTTEQRKAFASFLDFVLTHDLSAFSGLGR